ncbi:MAG: PEGA domain-containing protein [Myxococcota bacterium]
MSPDDAPGRAQLLRILDLPANADEARRVAALDRLVAALRARRAGSDASEADRRALDAEIARLEAARPTPTTAPRPDRLALLGALLGTFLTLAALAFYAGERDTRSAARQPSPLVVAGKARLEIEGSLPDATLRVFDADRANLVAERPASGAVVELSRGRYALEVSQPDCPEVWTRSAYFVVGSVQRFAPALCSGEGGLIVRANLPDAVLQIDDEVVGAPGETRYELAVGEHVIRVERDGFRSFTEQVRIATGQTVERLALLLPEKEPASRARRLDLGFDAASLAPPPPRAPTPFDMGDLAEALSPIESRRPSTRLLERAGLGGLPGGGSTAWHDRVSREFLARFDSDASGRIDRFEESEAISCDWWRETEQSFDEGGLGLSMARYYGFDGSEWHPGALGFEREVRGVAYERMRACGLQASHAVPDRRRA